VSTIESRTGEKYGFRVVPSGDATLHSLKDQRWLLSKYPFVGLSADVFAHVAVTLDWIDGIDCGFSDLPFNKPVLHSSHFDTLSKILRGWISIASCGKNVLIFGHTTIVSGLETRNVDIIMRRDDFIAHIQEIINAVDTARRCDCILFWDTMYP
jgi:hypothetical protein